MKKDILRKYKSAKKDLMVLWLSSFELGDSISETTDFVKFKSIDDFSRRLVMERRENGDSAYSFYLDLSSNELTALREYLLKNKDFVLKYIVNADGYFPGVHIYQLYLQLLSYKLNEVERSLFLDGYINVLKKSKGDEYAIEKRNELIKRLDLV